MVASNTMDLRVPANVNIVMLGFYDIVTFDALPTDDMTKTVF